MMGTMDEAGLRKKLLRELQGEMSGRRAGGLRAVIQIDPASEVREGEEGPAHEMAEGELDPASAVREGELDEPQDVKGRLGRLIRSKGY